ncbi:ATP-dependent helicase [Arthrobacter sp. M4]|uniref:ATP-dependent helicase n=1 Tax=Arthrobacter sp. M4 TaxID=218160 RepID=UPI0035AB74E2
MIPAETAQEKTDTEANPADAAQRTLRLLPPVQSQRGIPVLTADQNAVARLARGSGPIIVPGAPGTGKSTLLVEAAVRRVERDGVDPGRVLFLAPGRLAAAAMRDAFTVRLGRTLSTTPARTWASYAFDLIRRAKAEGILPLARQPKLLSGPEQDLIIKELLEGHVAPGRSLPWPADFSAALGTRGFRQEVRELFDRITESGRTAQDLRWLASQCQRPEWHPAAALFAEYRDVLDLRMPEAFDPAGIITAARHIFQDAPEFLEAERDRLELILVDDIQEANPAVFELLADVASGKDCIVTACPDSVVQGFRGARPDLVADLPRLLSNQHHPGAQNEGALIAAAPGEHTRAVTRPRVMPLARSHRLSDAVAQAWLAVAGRIPQRNGSVMSRRLDQGSVGSEGQPAAAEGSVEGHVFPSPMHELRYVAQRILEAHLKGGLGLSDIAVIVRNGGQLAQLQRYLEGQSIPVRVPVADTAVRDEVAVRPLLDLLGVVFDPSSLTAETAVSLLTSRLGGATAIEMRRLRQSLRREELLGGGGRSSDVLVVEALLAPGALATLGIEGSSARRIARMIQAGRAAFERPGANAESVLWALWDASGLAGRWRNLALDGGSAGARADRDLDAMMALFHAAERFVDQLPGSGAEQFLDYLLNQELPMDTLAARAQLEEAVEIMTPASAAGREWELVIIAGLQEGVWPNTRLRGELLGSTMFADAVEHGVEFAKQRGPLSRIRDIRHDELRSFSSSISRAKNTLICTAVSSEDQQPSPFLDYAAPPEPHSGSREYTHAGRPMTLRSLVAELRQHVQEPHLQSDGSGESTPESREAARVLATLANSVPPVPGAHPESWWGLMPLSSEGPVVPAGGTVAVSPSKVETVHKSPLDWFVQAAGGEAATDFARSLGTLVHSIAQDFPEASGAEYVAELLRRWPSLGMKDTWEGKLDFRRAEAMVRKLAQYIVLMRSEGRSLIGVEQDFAVRLPDVPLPAVPSPGETTSSPAPREPFPDEGSIADTAESNEAAARQAVLRGQVDRLEIDAEGRLVIVDLKTGRRQPGKAELAQHPQLGAYQAAVLLGAFGQGASPSTPGGAVLAQLGTSAKGPGVQQQEALSPGDNWALELVTEASVLMSAASFEARHQPGQGSHGGRGCRLPDICPLCARGKQVTE